LLLLVLLLLLLLLLHRVMVVLLVQLRLFKLCRRGGRGRRGTVVDWCRPGRTSSSAAVAARTVRLEAGTISFGIAGERLCNEKKGQARKDRKEREMSGE
jgi:hypothetical protein